MPVPTLGRGTWTRTEGHGRVVQECRLRPPAPDNHFLDCLVCPEGISLGLCRRGIHVGRDAASPGAGTTRATEAAHAGRPEEVMMTVKELTDNLQDKPGLESRDRGKKMTTWRKAGG